jgi:hypothetical protein
VIDPSELDMPKRTGVPALRWRWVAVGGLGAGAVLTITGAALMGIDGNCPGGYCCLCRKEKTSCFKEPSKLI